MCGELTLEHVERRVDRIAHALFPFRSTERGAGTGRDDVDLFRAVHVMSSVLERDVHTDQRRIPLAQATEPVVDEARQSGCSTTFWVWIRQTTCGPPLPSFEFVGLTIGLPSSAARYRV